MTVYNGLKYYTICICGSTKFKDEIFHWAKILTLEGWIVTMPLVFGHSGDDINELQKQELDDLHKAKILNADAVFVVNKNHYIGQSTKSEIEFAKSHKKQIIYMEEPEK